MLGFTRVTNSFDARKHCDRRRYEYILPAFMFDRAFQAAQTPTPIGAAGGPLVLGSGATADTEPASEPAQDSSAAGPGAIAVQEGATSRDSCGDMSAALGAAAGQSLDAGTASEPAQIPDGNGAPAGSAEQQGESSELAGGQSADTAQNEGVPGSESRAEGGTAGQEERPFVRRSTIDGAAAAAAAEAAGSRQCRFSAEQQARLNEVLGAFEGTHSFHNYTVRVPASDPAAKRYILSFKCAGTMNLEVGLPAVAHQLLLLLEQWLLLFLCLMFVIFQQDTTSSRLAA